MQNREHAISIYKAAVAAVQPSKLLPQYVEVLPAGIRIADTIIQAKGSSLYVIGAGKAVAAMAQTIASILGDQIKAGLVVTKYAHALPLAYIKVIESAHPVPDEKSVAAAQQTIELLKQTGPGDVILCLLSGGASSLWADVPEGCNLDELQQCFQLLLKSGAAIEEMNCVRRHLSSIKGGQLLRHAPQAQWHTLIISDVPGDQLEAIASGPTAADPTSFADAWKVIEKYQLQSQFPASVLQHLQNGLKGSIPETLKENDPLLLQVKNQIIGSNQVALAAAAKQAAALGYTVILQEELLTGDAATTAASIMEQAKQYKGKRPACLLFGGETTVSVTGSGKGGRNQHLALCALQYLEPTDRMTLLAAGTDGTDGPTDAAGAFADSNILLSIEGKNIVIQDVIQKNDAYHFFEDVKGLLKTGATQTNVMDILIVLLD
jgi:glycerate 2-kinase